MNADKRRWKRLAAAGFVFRMIARVVFLCLTSFLILGCDNLRTHRYLKQEERLITIYSGDDPKKSLAAMAELEALTSTEERANNGDLRYEYVYGQIDARRWMLYSHLGDTTNAQRAFESSKRHFAAQRSDKTPIVSDEQYQQSMRRLDVNLFVAWKQKTN